MIVVIVRCDSSGERGVLIDEFPLTNQPDRSKGNCQISIVLILKSMLTVSKSLSKSFASLISAVIQIVIQPDAEHTTATTNQMLTNVMQSINAPDLATFNKRAETYLL